MYEKFYGFQEKPFSLLSDPAFLYHSKRHALALTYLEYGISEQAGFIVITGEVGAGKTTLIKYLINTLDIQTTKVAMIFNTNIAPRDLLEFVLKEWDLSCNAEKKVELYETLNNFLIQEYVKKHKVILIIDEAQNLPSETLEELRMISNLNDEKQPMIHIILSGQPNLRARLNQSDLEQLRQRISVHYHLGPLDREETGEYIKHRLKKAGSENPAIFTADAMESIHTYSGGIPRIINMICDTALVYGFAEDLKVIDKPIITSVIADREKGGLGFTEVSAEPLAGHLSMQRNALSKEILTLKEHDELLHENILELSLLVKKIMGSKDTVAKVSRENLHKKEKQLQTEQEKNRQLKAANKELKREVDDLMKKIKDLEKKLLQKKRPYPKIVP